MGSGRDKLSATRVAKATARGRYGDGGGLWLQVSKWKTKSWVFQYTAPNGRVRQLGLGSLHDVTLAEARDAADAARKLVKADIDPIEARREKRSQARLAAAQHVTFKDCAEKYIAVNKDAWRNEKHVAQWKATLATYAYPTLGALSVASIDTGLVLKVLEPIWKTKPETAGRLRGRIERILNFAKTRGWRSDENPARWKGHLDNSLPTLRKLKKVRHHPALPYDELPAFMAELRTNKFVSARALEFLIPTATRTGEVIGARWDEIDFAQKTWTVPKERMKAQKEHRIPLSERALAVLDGLQRETDSPFLFIGGKEGTHLSDMAMLELMKGMRPGFVPHGFRSTFRDGVAETTNYPNHVVEMALAHVIDNKVEAAYRRGDLFEKRRRLMNEWARFCQKPAGTKTDNVTPIRALEKAT